MEHWSTSNIGLRDLENWGREEKGEEAREQGKKKQQRGKKYYTLHFMLLFDIGTHKEFLINFTSSQKQRMIKVRRDLWKSPSPTLLPKAVSPGASASRWVLNVSTEGEPMSVPGSLFQCPASSDINFFLILR